VWKSDEGAWCGCVLWCVGFIFNEDLWPRLKRAWHNDKTACTEFKMNSNSWWGPHAPKLANGEARCVHACSQTFNYTIHHLLQVTCGFSCELTCNFTCGFHLRISGFLKPTKTHENKNHKDPDLLKMTSWVQWWG
jgi:hypothetical protein